jgi:acetoin utilization deacetylase AcuC-like enzyme
MLSLYDPNHPAHAPQFEFYRGERVPCFENPSRADFVLAQLRSKGHRLEVPSADSSAAIAQIHSTRYVDFLRTAWLQWLALDGNNQGAQPFPSVWPVRGLRSDLEPTNFIAKLGLYSMDNGTPLDAGTWSVTKKAADAGVHAAQLICSNGLGRERAVFCATRPPGHHAGADFMGGYCFLNHAAIAAQALRNFGHAKVAIVDVDFHHGNGTQEIFYARGDVFYASIHGDPRTEYPFYLGYADERGIGEGSGANFNIPLAARTDSTDWFAAFSLTFVQVQQFQPSALVISLGLDTFADDPIANFNLSSLDYIELGRRIAGLKLPTIFILEGGYAAQSLGVNAVNVIEGFESFF